MPFGTHEPHLAKKVADAVKRIRTEKKSRAVAEVPKRSMTQLHESIKAQNAALMLQPGPRPQKPKVAPRVQWSPPSIDHSIPTTAHAYGVCLDLLVNAIFNREDCMESENKEFQNRYYADATYYTESAVRALAERVLVRHLFLLLNIEC